MLIRNWEGEEWARDGESRYPRAATHPSSRPTLPAGYPPSRAATLEIVPEDPPEERGETANPSVELTTNGVGPWRGDHPDDLRYDPELLANGDSRNVVDRYRYWRMEAIVADLDESRHPFQVAIENWQHDMNIGSIVRSANAFGADTVHIIGRKRWNKRGAMVTDRYQHEYHHPSVQDLVV